MLLFKKQNKTISEFYSWLNHQLSLTLGQDTWLLWDSVCAAVELNKKNLKLNREPDASSKLRLSGTKKKKSQNKVNTRIVAWKKKKMLPLPHSSKFLSLLTVDSEGLLEENVIYTKPQALSKTLDAG